MNETTQSAASRLILVHGGSRAALARHDAWATTHFGREALQWPRNARRHAEIRRHLEATANAWGVTK